MKIDEVKKDLKNLRLYNRSVSKLKELKTTHEMRIKMLEKMGESEKAKEIIEREKALVSSLDFATKIDKALSLEEKYMGFITSLDPLERDIIIDTYINGHPYWKIGLEIGYSEEGVRKKVSKIIKGIAHSMSEVAVH